MRILAIDFGLKKIGIATTDLSKTIAYPLKTIFSKKNLDLTVDHILLELKDILLQTEKIIIGLPLHMDGNESKMSEIVRNFSKILYAKTNIAVQLIDERLTSKQVEKDLLNNFNLTAKKRAKLVDPMSAALLLSNFLS